MRLKLKYHIFVRLIFYYNIALHTLTIPRSNKTKIYVESKQIYTLKKKKLITNTVTV